MTIKFTIDQRRILSNTARRSIQHGLHNKSPLVPQTDHYDPALTKDQACFVTLKLNGNLRGCIGHLLPIQPLICDVAENAWSAAYRDQRFTPVTEQEYQSLSIEISVLSIPEKISFISESDLLNQINPGIDGLILHYQDKRGTFLPTVWKSLPDKRLFLIQLKIKAGLAGDFWSDEIQVERYQTISFSSSD